MLRSDTVAPAPAPALTHRQLAVFRAIMLHGNLSRAAEVTASSQPTLSRELARLEQVLGFDLFDRIKGRLRPTVRAMALMQEVERSFVGIDHIAATAQALRTQATGHLRLACLPALAQAFVPHALALFAAQLPEASVSITPEESPWLEQAMGQQRYDLGLSETTQAPTGVAMRSILSLAEVAVLPLGHRLASKMVLKPQDFAGERFISLAPSDPYRQQIDQMFSTAGVERQLCLETASAVAVCAMVRRGLGVAIVNPLTALELASGKPAGNTLAGTGLLIKPLSVPITFQISLLLPTVAPEHPLRAAMVSAIEQAAHALQARAIA
jgi:DNA-binding transcriptional LysR family regulator